MGKKVKFELTRNESLQGIDLELEEAMSELDGANDRIGTILAGFNQQPGHEADYAELDENGDAVTDSEQAGPGGE